MKKVVIFIFVTSHIFHSIAFAEDTANGTSSQIDDGLIPIDTAQEDTESMPQSDPANDRSVSGDVSVQNEHMITKIAHDVPEEKDVDMKIEHTSEHLIPLNEASQQKSIRFNEILADPINGYEFIELHNTGESSVDISGWRVCDLSTYDKSTSKCSLSHSNKFIFAHSSIIAPHGYMTIYQKTDFKFILNNTDEEIFLEDHENNIIDHHLYKKSHKGVTWNYDDKDWYEEMPTPQTSNAPNPRTKEYPNLILNELLPQPQDNADQNEFIEIYNPFDTSLSIENYRLADTSQTGSFTFSPANYSPCKTRPDRCLLINPQSFLVVYRSDFSFALNDYGTETVNLYAPDGKLSSTFSYISSRKSMSYNRSHSWYIAKPTPGLINNPDKRTIFYPHILLNELHPNPIGDENNNEYIELHNPHDHAVDLEDWMLRDTPGGSSYIFPALTSIAPHGYYVVYRSNFIFALNNSDETIELIAPNEKRSDIVSYTSSKENSSYNFDTISRTWRWSKHLTPERKNILNNIPRITSYSIKKIGYKNTWTEFEATAQDLDREKLKVRWDFGDNRKSYLWKTRHKYTENGTYYGTLRIQDASEEVLIPFTIIIKNYPSYDINITAIAPNPTGTDSGKEYIILTNNESKKINLKGWSIATGSTKEKIVNHPLKNELILTKRSSLTITKNDCAISLPNTTGYVELRAPDGTVLDSVSYMNNNGSIPNDAIYGNMNGSWSWHFPHLTAENALIFDMLTVAAENENKRRMKAQEQDAIHNMIHTENEMYRLKKLSHEFSSFLDSISKTFNTYLSQLFYKLLRTASIHAIPNNIGTIQNIPHNIRSCIYNSEFFLSTEIKNVFCNNAQKFSSLGK